MTVCDAGVRRFVHDEFYRREQIEVRSESELSSALGFNGRYSNNQVLAAVGSLVNCGSIIRSRRQPEFIGDDDRPIIYRLAKS